MNLRRIDRLSKLADFSGGRFVIQDHHATSHHWDFRLEMPGLNLKKYFEKRTKETPEPLKDKAETALASWAIPKHHLPSKSEKTLAVEVEPHILSYASFEGEIPKGSYGAGTVSIYDSGLYKLLSGSLEEGKLKIKLNGEKEHGTYNLIRTKDNQWLIMEAKEKIASYPTHPDTEILPGITELDIWNYYQKHKHEIIHALKGYDVLIRMKVDGGVIKRHDNGNPIQLTEENFDRIITGRTIELHRVLSKMTTIIWVDLDDHRPDSNFDELKEYAQEIKELMDSMEEVKSTELQFSGGTGIYVIGYLYSEKDVDEMRNELKEILNTAYGEDSRVTTGIAEPNQIRLDISTLKTAGSIKAPWSLSMTGKASIPIENLETFNPSQINIKTASHEIMGRWYAPDGSSYDVSNTHWQWAMENMKVEPDDLLKKGWMQFSYPSGFRVQNFETTSFEILKKMYSLLNNLILEGSGFVTFIEGYEVKHMYPQTLIRMLDKLLWRKHHFNFKLRIAAVTLTPLHLMALKRVTDISEIPEGRWWIEKKYDGWLTSCIVNEEGIPELWSRRGNFDYSNNFPEIIEELDYVPSGTYLIGELIWRTPDGKQNESAIASLAATKNSSESFSKRVNLKGHVEFILFDCLYSNGESIIDQSIKERREILNSIIRESDHVKISEIFSLEETQKVIDTSLKEGGEGIVIKNKDAKYYIGEEKELRPAGVQYKLKKKHVDWDVVIFEYTSKPGSDKIVFHGGYFNQNGKMTENLKLDNFSKELEQRLKEKLDDGEKFVISVEAQEVTDNNLLRQPRFIRLREDRDPKSVTWEQFEEKKTASYFCQKRVDKIKKGDLYIKIADTPVSRTRGLMGIRYLPENEGMLFVHDSPMNCTYHSRNCKIPLDIAFLDQEGSIINLVQTEPERPQFYSSKKCSFVLETNRGWFEQRGLKSGCNVFDAINLVTR